MSKILDTLRQDCLDNFVVRSDSDYDAVIAFSGGQDSTTLLAWCVNVFGADRVVAIGFDYSQKHNIELVHAKSLTTLFDVKFEILSLNLLKELGATALTDDTIIVNADATGTGNLHAERAGLPSTFVPARNLLFLSAIGAFAAKHHIKHIVTGICEADEAGYPDCRKGFADSFINTLNLALGLVDNDAIKLLAPLLNLDKKNTWLLAEELGVKEIIIHHTHTCYNGDRNTLHSWGYGCAKCPACIERANGFNNAFNDKGGK